MSKKITKERAFERAIHKYWERLVSKILAPGNPEHDPSEEEYLSAYNELIDRHPECSWTLLKYKPNPPSRKGERISGIRVVRQFNSVSTFEMALMSKSYLSLKIEGVAPIFQGFKTCDLSQTVKNLDEFINKFSSYMQGYEKKKLEFDKKSKLENMTKSSIQTTISQLLPPMGYKWRLVERGKDFFLQLAGHGTRIGLTLNSKNFVNRFSALPEMLKQIDSLFNTLPFPIDVSKMK